MKKLDEQLSEEQKKNIEDMARNASRMIIKGLERYDYLSMITIKK